MILYAGSYTQMIADNFGGHGDGLYCFAFDPVNGSLRRKHAHPAINPSYLCIPSPQYLYTHTELLQINKPRVQAFSINQNDFSLRLINEQEIPGGFPCHINFSKRNNCMLVACYETGNIFIYPLGSDGSLLPRAGIMQHEGGSVNQLHQEKAHAHATVIDENFNTLLVTDLGIDKVMVYSIDPGSGEFKKKLKQELLSPPGSGPRHIAFHPEKKFAFVINEFTASVTVMRYHEGRLEQLYTYPTLPTNFKEIPSAAAIRVSANGKFIYISERGDNGIAILGFDSNKGTIEVIGWQQSMGKTPRDIQIDPTGNWLLAANQDSDSIAIFKIDKKTGLIKPKHLMEQIKSPACLEWFPAK